MSDIITGLRQAIQDLIAPGIKALQMKVDALNRQIEVQHDAMMKTVEAFRAEMRSEFVALRANTQLDVLRQVSPLSERISVVEESGARKFRAQE
jgi:Mg2+ and Co2+ transporter CorA